MFWFRNKKINFLVGTGQALILTPSGSGDVLFFPVRLSVCPTVRLSGLQIRGGKGYFSIDFLEFSIEN